MSDELSIRPHASRTCTTVGVAPVVLGSAAFLLDGGGQTVVAAAYRVLIENLACFGCVSAVICLITLGVVLGQAVFIGIVTVTMVALAVVLCGSAAVGWMRIVGITILESSRAIGSPIWGTGLLMAAMGFVALAYCLTPLRKPVGEIVAKGDAKLRIRSPYADKRDLAALAFLLAVLVPGWLGALAPNS